MRVSPTVVYTGLIAAATAVVVDANTAQHLVLEGPGGREPVPGSVMFLTTVALAVLYTNLRIAVGPSTPRKPRLSLNVQRIVDSLTTHPEKWKRNQDWLYYYDYENGYRIEIRCMDGRVYAYVVEERTVGGYITIYKKDFNFPWSRDLRALTAAVAPFFPSQDPTSLLTKILKPNKPSEPPADTSLPVIQAPVKKAMSPPANPGWDCPADVKPGDRIVVFIPANASTCQAEVGAVVADVGRGQTGDLRIRVIFLDAPVNGHTHVECGPRAQYNKWRRADRPKVDPDWDCPPLCLDDKIKFEVYRTMVSTGVVRIISEDGQGKVTEYVVETPNGQHYMVGHGMRFNKWRKA